MQEGCRRCRCLLSVLLISSCLSQAAVALTPLQALRHTVDEAREPEGGTAQRGRVLLQQLSTFADGRYDYCSFEPMPDKVVVVAASKFDLSYIQKMGLKYFPYQHLDMKEPYWYPNEGNEAGAYLQFILDHWECMPKAMAFIHGHEHESWHSASMHDILPKLRWEAATFADINRKMPLWEIPLGHIQSTPKAQLLAEGADVYNGSFPLDQIYRGKAYESWMMSLWLQHTAFARAYDRFFGPYGLGPMPDMMHYVCCAQFMVSGARVQARGRHFYEMALQYLKHNDLRGNHLLGEQYIRGDVFSLYWGMMFGEPASYMPRDECDTFHCEPGSKSGGQARLQTSTEAAVLEQGSETSTTGKWALPLNLTKTEQSETRALQGERRQQLREERRLRGSNSRARTK